MCHWPVEADRILHQILHQILLQILHPILHPILSILENHLAIL